LQWTDEHGTRRFGAGDMLVVAAYNAQVLTIRRHLDEAGLRGVQAGTVDKFQGRQAPVVFFSLAASSIDDVPRAFLALTEASE
jgi:superfamily I DNA and/or RNA helicase